VLRVILGLHFADTQCGFKAFRRDAAQRIFPLQRIERWGFDPEVLFLARRAGLRVEEVPFCGRTAKARGYILFAMDANVRGSFADPVECSDWGVCGGGGDRSRKLVKKVPSAWRCQAREN